MAVYDDFSIWNIFQNIFRIFIVFPCHLIPPFDALWNRIRKLIFQGSYAECEPVGYQQLYNRLPFHSDGWQSAVGFLIVLDDEIQQDCSYQQGKTGWLRILHSDIKSKKYAVCFHHWVIRISSADVWNSCGAGSRENSSSADSPWLCGNVICVICSTSFSIMIMSAAATVNFMTQKMIVEFEEGKEPGTVMKDVLKACKKVEPDCEIAL